MRPRMPPPVPYCQALPWPVAVSVSSAMGAACVSRASHSWAMKTLRMARENILYCFFLFFCFFGWLVSAN